MIIKNSKSRWPLIVRVISCLIIISFLFHDISWAYPDNFTSTYHGNDKLAPKSFFTEAGSPARANEIYRSLIESRDLTDGAHASPDGAAVEGRKMELAALASFISVPILFTAYLFNASKITAVITLAYIVMMGVYPVMTNRYIERALSFRSFNKHYGLIRPFRDARSIQELWDHDPDSRDKVSYYSYTMGRLYVYKEAMRHVPPAFQRIIHFHEELHGRFRVKTEIIAVPLTYCIPWIAAAGVLSLFFWALPAGTVSYLAIFAAYNISIPLLMKVLAWNIGIKQSAAGHYLISADSRKGLSPEEVDYRVSRHAHRTTRDPATGRMEYWRDWMRGSDADTNVEFIECPGRPEDIIVVKAAYRTEDEARKSDGSVVQSGKPALREAFRSSDKRAFKVVVAVDHPSDESEGYAKRRFADIVRDIKEALRSEAPSARLRIGVRSTFYDITRLQDMVRVYRSRIGGSRASHMARDAVACEVHGKVDRLNRLLQWLGENSYSRVQFMGDYLGKKGSLGFEAIDVLDAHIRSGKLPKVSMLVGKSEYMFLLAIMGDESIRGMWRTMPVMEGPQVMDSLRRLASLDINEDLPEGTKAEISAAREFEAIIRRRASRAVGGATDAEMDRQWNEWYYLHPKLQSLAEFMVNNMRFVYAENKDHIVYIIGDRISEKFERHGLKGLEALRDMEGEFRENARSGIRILKLMSSIWLISNRAGRKELSAEDMESIRKEIVKLIEEERERNKVLVKEVIPDKVLTSMEVTAMAALDAGNLEGMVDCLGVTLMETQKQMAEIYKEVFSSGETPFDIGLARKPDDERESFDIRQDRRMRLGINAIVNTGIFTKEAQSLGQVIVYDDKGDLILREVDSLGDPDPKYEHLLTAVKSDFDSLGRMEQAKLDAIDKVLDRYDGLVRISADPWHVRLGNTIKHILWTPLFGVRPLSRKMPRSPGNTLVSGAGDVSGMGTMLKGVGDYDRLMEKVGFTSPVSSILKRRKVYLDAGCGVGLAALEAAQRNPQLISFGVDIDEIRDDRLMAALHSKVSWINFVEARARLAAEGRYRFTKADITDVRLAKRPGVVTAFFVLEHTEDPLRAFANLYNQLENGGTIVATVAGPKQTGEGSYYRQIEKMLRDEGLADVTVLPNPYVNSPDVEAYIIKADKKSALPLRLKLRLADSKTVAFDIAGERVVITVPRYAEGDEGTDGADSGKREPPNMSYVPDASISDGRGAEWSGNYDGADKENPVIRAHIYSGRAVEIVDDDTKVVRIRRDRSNPRDPPVEVRFRSTGILDKVRRARDENLLRRQLALGENFHNFTPDEQEKLISEVRKITLSVILGRMFVNERDGRTQILHVRTGFSRRIHGLDGTIWIGEKLLARLTADQLARAMLEECQHRVRPERTVNGVRHGLHWRMGVNEDPRTTVKHDPLFVAMLTRIARDYNRGEPPEWESYIRGSSSGFKSQAANMAGPLRADIIDDIIAQAKADSQRPEVRAVEDLCVYGESNDRDSPKKDFGIFFATPTPWALQTVHYMRALNPRARICDLGSGNGAFCFFAAQYFSDITGIEARKGVYEDAVRHRKALNNVSGVSEIKFINADFLKEETDLSGYDTLYFFYTKPDKYAAHPEWHSVLKNKLVSAKGMKAGAKLIVLGSFGALFNDADFEYEEVRMGRMVLGVYTRTDSKAMPYKYEPADIESDDGRRYPDRGEKVRAESVYKDYMEALFETNISLFVSLAERKKARNGSDAVALKKALDDTAARIAAMNADIEQFDKRLAALPDRMQMAEEISRVKEKFAAAQRLVASNNETAANAALIGALNIISDARDQMLKSRMRAPRAGIGVSKRDGKFVMRQHSYVVAESVAKTRVPAYIEKGFDLRWQAGRSLDDQEDGIMDERDDMTEYAELIGKNLKEAEAGRKIDAGDMDHILSGLKGVLVEEKRLARIALAAVRRLIDLGETSDIKHLLPVVRTHLGTRADDIQRILEYLKAGRIDPFRKIVKADNDDFRRRIGEALSRIETGYYKGARGSIYGLLKKAKPYLAEPDLEGLDSMLWPAIADLDKLVALAGKGAKDAEPSLKASAKSWVELAEKKLEGSQRLNEFMEFFRERYAERRRAGRSGHLREDAFVELFEEFAKDKQLTRGSPELKSFQILCYLAVFVSMDSPAFKPINALRLIIEIDNIGTILKARKLHKLKETMALVESLRGRNAVRNFSIDERVRLTKALAKDFGLDEKDRFRISQAFAINKENLRREYKADELKRESPDIDSGSAEPPQIESMDFIGRGADSSVYRSGEKVYKMYTENSEAQIRLYRYATAMVRQRLERESGKDSVMVNGRAYKTFYRVNPVGDITRSGNKVFAESAFVPGVRLGILFGYDASAFDKAVRGLDETREAEYRKIAADRSSLENIKNILYRKTKMCGDELGLGGISLSSLDNVMIDLDQENGAAVFTVTDICTAIDYLEVRPAAPHFVFDEGVNLNDIIGYLSLVREAFELYGVKDAAVLQESAIGAVRKLKSALRMILVGRENGHNPCVNCINTGDCPVVQSFLDGKKPASMHDDGCSAAKCGMPSADIGAAMRMVDGFIGAYDGDEARLVGLRKFLTSTARPGAPQTDARVLLSENLFIDEGGDDAFLQQMTIAIGSLLKSGAVAIMAPDEMRRMAMNRSVTRENMALVFTREDFEDKTIWNGSDKETSLRSSVLILDDRMTGSNYLYLEGVIGLAHAIMSDDRPAIREYYRLISGVAIDDRLLDLLKDGGQNNVAFAVKAMLRFRPIGIIADSEEFNRARLAMENALISA